MTTPAYALPPDVAYDAGQDATVTLDIDATPVRA